MAPAHEGRPTQADRALALVRRYQPLVLTLTAIVLIAFALGVPPSEETTTTAEDSGAGDVQTPGDEAGSGQAAGRTSVAGGGVSGGPAAVRPLTLEQAREEGLQVDFGPNCDAARGTIKFPSRYAPPCVLPHTGPNGDRTSKGVSQKEIVVAVYRAQSDPATQAIVQAAGANDQPEEVEQTFRDWADMFEDHYETYGRKVKLVFVDASGPSDDDVAGRADAKRVALQIGAFAAWAHLGAPAAFVDELSARGVIWITGETRPTDFYLKRAPYGWGVQMNLDQGYQHASEFIGKRLWGRNARFAGAPDLQVKKRRFGLIYNDGPDNANQSAADFFERDLERYGAKLAFRASHRSSPEQAQEDARSIIQRFITEGITSVVITSDPISPIFITQEATRQRYFPEWVTVGGNLIDTNFFGRTYDQQQWTNAFGVAQLTVPMPFDQSEYWFQHLWHHKREPTAHAEHGIIYQPEFIFYTAVHLAGPVLTPVTFRDGLFAYPVIGDGITTFQRSFGSHGFWSKTDFGAFDDATEVWWDPGAVGDDEVGNPGKGMYRWVSGGKRYVPGRWPSTEPKVRVVAGSVLSYAERPPQDDFPDYEHKHY